MKFLRFRRVLRASLLLLLPFSFLTSLQAQGAKAKTTDTPSHDADTDHEKERSDWFLRGRVVPGKSSAELRHRAYQVKMQARTARLTRAGTAAPGSQSPSSPGGWVPLGPVPLASDATGDGFQNYNQVSGRATAVAIDPADASGNTIYIGGAQGGVWKSVNAATSIANNVAWTATTDDQATLSIGAIAIQPGNSNPANSVILVGTGEADNSADSYFGLGILRSADGGNTWAPIINAANGGTLGTLSFSGLGVARMAFSTASTNTVVAAMASTAEGITDGALTGNTFPGLYTSTDAGQTWAYDALFSGASEATSATSVVYNASAGFFFAAVRYHGFYSSSDGLTWTPLANQPGASGLLSAAACPQNFSSTCPIYRGEITVVPARNEMYVWFVSLDANGNEVDQGVWQSLNGGTSWTPINDSGIINCGDFDGCGVEQGSYNLELLAIPNGAQATDLYAGAINLYKCSITSINPSCGNTAFINLTHAYGCSPLAALAHVHPDQHALAYTIPTAGDALMYFANDGGIYRALNGFTGLNTGSCSGTNLFDDLNQNLGSMTQFVSFSQNVTDPNTLLGGTQDNGSPATAAATTSSSWGNVLSGDGGYNAIDPNTGAWFASNPDTGSGTLNIQQCVSGTSCDDSLFNSVISSSNLGGDDGAFYFPYILDPQSTTNLLVGTCRVWSGPRSGGVFTLLSLNFDTLGTGTCAGTEVNVVRSLAIAHNGTSGAQVIYATTDGPGPNTITSPVGGNVWVTTNATAVSGTVSSFANVTLNGPGGASINPNQFPISGVAIDSSDPSGNTAYVTVMGFTGGLGPGHVWQTTNAGANWIDFTAAGTSSPLPDSPVNAVVVDPAAHMVYVGTDVGVFGSSTSSAAWTEVGAMAGPNEAGFLPNVAVTALAIFNSGNQKLLRASTYGRGVWQFNLLAAPDFQIAVSNPSLTVFQGRTATFDGTLTAMNGYTNSIALSCVAEGSPPLPVPSPCVPTSVPSTWAPVATFSLSPDTNTIGDYKFDVQGAGSDANSTTHEAAVVLNVINIALVSPLPLVTDSRGAASAPANFQVQLMAQGSFNESATLSCSFPSIVSGVKCAFTPSATVTLTSASPASMTVVVTVPATTPVDLYPVTLQATTTEGTVSLNPPFTLNVVPNPTFILAGPPSFPNVKAGSASTTGVISIASQDGFVGNVALTCTTTSGSCSVASPVTLTSSGPGDTTTAALTINGSDSSAGSYQVVVTGTSGSLTGSSPPVLFNVGDYMIAGTKALTSIPGRTAVANLTFTSEDSYAGSVLTTCNVIAPAGAAPVSCILNTPLGGIPVGNGIVGSLNASVALRPNVAVGSYTIDISTQDANGGEPSHTWTTTVIVEDFALASVTPSSQSIGSGEIAKYSLSVNPIGASFSNPVTLSCSGVPANSTCSFTPNPVTPGNGPAAVTMTIAMGATTPQGNNSISITGTSGSTLSHTATASLTVANTLLLKSVKSFPSAADAGTQQAAKVSLTPNYSGSVTATCNAPGLPAEQCTISPVSPIAVSGSPVTLTAILNIPKSAVPGAYSINILVGDAAGGAPSTSIALPLNVAQDYTIENLPPTAQTITAGQSITYNLAVAPVGTAYSNTVTLSCTGAPLFNGTCALSPNSVGPLSNSTSAAVVMTVTTQAIAAQAWFPGRKCGPWMYGICLPFAAVLLWGTARSRRYSVVLPLGAAFVLLWLLTSCGGGSNGGTSAPGSTPQGTPITYTITVIGSPASISQPSGSAVTLIVN
jgi:hypothetical protein